MMRATIAVIAAVALTGCQSEEDCAAEISRDLDAFREQAMKDGKYKLAKQAIDSSLRISVIKIEENLDACDYFAYGSVLIRKP